MLVLFDFCQSWKVLACVLWLDHIAQEPEWHHATSKYYVKCCLISYVFYAVLWPMLPTPVPGCQLPLPQGFLHGVFGVLQHAKPHTIIEGVVFSEWLDFLGCRRWHARCSSVNWGQAFMQLHSFHQDQPVKGLTDIYSLCRKKKNLSDESDLDVKWIIHYMTKSLCTPRQCNPCFLVKLFKSFH